MSKNKIKEIEQKYDMWADDFNLDPQEIEWLIEQTGRAIKNAEDLHVMDLQLASEQKQNKRCQESIRDIGNAWKVADNYQEYMDTVHDIIKALEESE